MTKQVTVEEFKGNLDALIREAREGATIEIVSEGATIATLEPPRHHGHRGVRYPFREFDFGSRPSGLRTDAAELVREDRDSESHKLPL